MRVDVALVVHHETTQRGILKAPHKKSALFPYTSIQRDGVARGVSFVTQLTLVLVVIAV